MGEITLFIAALSIQNESKLESFETKEALLARAGSLGYGDKVERVFSITHSGVFKGHKVLFTDRLELVLEG
ncbi:MULTISPECIES: hypothetical protein [unclassified Peribacillus]|uniref:hypothetical protein n=1 Tax=unclassified Peribacillus TaxID=2675266 RepID=UPI00367202FE